MKILLGIFTGITAITADGFHSLADSAPNVVGFFGIRLARKELDKKYARLRQIRVGGDAFRYSAHLDYLLPRCLKEAWERFFHPQAAQIRILTFALMIVSMLVNVITVIYEGSVGRRLKSELLIADSDETKSGLLISGSVILGIAVIETTGWFRMEAS